MSDCIFCKIVAGTAPSWKVLESEHAYAFLDIHPVSKYHTLVIPKQHHVNVFDAPAEALREVISLAKEVVSLYEDKLGIQNLQLVSSSGREAQQDVFHLHFHIVPRQQGDGQNIRWKTFPEMRSDYDQMIEALLE
jgi:histidine triad (HIT) family protein